LVIRRHWTVRNDDESLWHFFGRFDPARSATPVREFLVSLLRGSVAHRHYLVMNDRQYDLGYFMPDESPILLHDWSKWRYAWKRSFSFSDIRQRTSLFWQVRSLCLELGLIRWNGDEDYELTAAGREQIA
jgi:hypothetical protein